MAFFRVGSFNVFYIHGWQLTPPKSSHLRCTVRCVTCHESVFVVLTLCLRYSILVLSPLLFKMTLDILVLFFLYTIMYLFKRNVALRLSPLFIFPFYHFSEILFKDPLAHFATIRSFRGDLFPDSSSSCSYGISQLFHLSPLPGTSAVPQRSVNKRAFCILEAVSSSKWLCDALS